MVVATDAVSQSMNGYERLDIQEKYFVEIMDLALVTQHQHWDQFLDAVVVTG